MGLLQSSSRLLNTFYAIWNELGLLPEEMDYAKLYSTGQPSEPSAHYPLRPELIESTYHHYRATQDNSWLSAAVTFLDNIEQNTRTSCGYAAVERKGITSTQVDSMPSFFLSETVKYLYLLFDENNFINQRSYVFSTEAHPFDSLQISKISNNNYSHFHEYLVNASASAGVNDEGDEELALPSSSSSSSSTTSTSVLSVLSSSPLDSKNRVLPNKCRKRSWWENSLSSYDPNYSELMASQAARTNFQDMKENWIQNVPELFVLPKSSVFPTSSSSLLSNIRRKGNNNVCYSDPLQHANSLHFTSTQHAQNNKRNLHDPHYKQASSSHIEENSQENNVLNDVKKAITVNYDQVGEFHIEIFEDGNLFFP